MKHVPLLALAMALASIVPAAAQRASDHASNAARKLADAYIHAWNASDPHAIAQLFASNADFISPAGVRAVGRAEIEAFYASAFRSGYTGSTGEGGIVAVRSIAPRLALVDGQWRISGAKNPDGSPRAAEQGILTAVIKRTAHGWRIFAWRENASATKITPLASAK